MTFANFLKPTSIKIFLTLIIPFSLRYGVNYNFDFSLIGNQAGKPNLITNDWSADAVPLIANMPLSMVGWLQPVQRVVTDNYIFNDIVTFLATITVNYFLSCVVVFMYRKFRND